MAIKTIYAGGYIPDIGVGEGWLWYKHPDGQWVSLAKVPRPEFTEHISRSELDTIERLGDRASPAQVAAMIHDLRAYMGGGA